MKNRYVISIDYTCDASSDDHIARRIAIAIGEAGCAAGKAAGGEDVLYQPFHLLEENVQDPV